MTALDLTRLKALAQAARTAPDYTMPDDLPRELREYLKGCSSAAVLELVERLERAEALAETLDEQVQCLTNQRNELKARVEHAEGMVNGTLPAMTQCPMCYCVHDPRLGQPEHDTDLRNMIDPPPAAIIQAAEEVRIWMDSQNRGTDWQLAGVCSREAVAVRDARIAEIEARLRRAEAMLAASSPSNREGELSIVMSMRQGDTLFSAGRHVPPEQIRSFAGSAINHVRLEASRVYQQLQNNIAGDPTPTDPLDDVLPTVEQLEEQLRRMQNHEPPSEVFGPDTGGGRHG